MSARRFPIGVGLRVQYAHIGSRGRRIQRTGATRDYEKRMRFGVPASVEYMHRYCQLCGAHLNYTRFEEEMGFCLECRPEGLTLLSASERQYLREARWDWDAPVKTRNTGGHEVTPRERIQESMEEVYWKARWQHLLWDGVGSEKEREFILSNLVDYEYAYDNGYAHRQRRFLYSWAEAAWNARTCEEV